MGGLPAWLLTLNRDVYLRSDDLRYTAYVERWLQQLMPKVKPLLYGNGGPVIMVQIENEYGSYPVCNRNHMLWLRDQFKYHVREAAVLFTADGYKDEYLKCGKTDGVYATVNFATGVNVDYAFGMMRKYEPRGPLVNSEFYLGWFTAWYWDLQAVETEAILQTLDQMLAVNASVNCYMFSGGTNFGFTSGAHYYTNYMPMITSYDYDAPVTEAGDLTEKYFAIRSIIGKYLPLPNTPLLVSSKKGNYGTVRLQRTVSLLEPPAKWSLGSSPFTSLYPMSFEELGQSYSMVLYEARIPHTFMYDPVVLIAKGVKDRALVCVDKMALGLLNHKPNSYSLKISLRNKKQIKILVENQGRISTGPHLKDYKGLGPDVILNGRSLTGWTMTGFQLTNISGLDYISEIDHNSTNNGPAFFKGEFQLPAGKQPKDTFLDMQGWRKGVAFMNGHNLGRYWPVAGPQLTLYVPACYLLSYPASNKLVLLEIDVKFMLNDLKVEFVTEPIYIKAQAIATSPAAISLIFIVGFGIAIHCT